MSHSKPNVLFVTGTDTGVGKTFVSSLLVRSLHELGYRIAVMKPVETGCMVDAEGRFIPSDGILLWEASGKHQAGEDVAPFRYQTAVAPSVAATIEGQSIDYALLSEMVRGAALDVDLLLVEGAGGLMVPLNEQKTFLDFEFMLHEIK